VNTIKLESALNSVRAELIRKKQQTQALNAFVKTAKVRQVMETLLGFTNDDTMTLYSFCGDQTIYANLHVRGLEGFKDVRLMTILMALEFHDPDHTDSTEYAANRQKTFSYTFEGSMSEHGIVPQIKVNVEASIVEDSKTCERVVIGMTEPKPQPIYKLVCDGDTAPADIEDAAQACAE